MPYAEQTGEASRADASPVFVSLRVNRTPFFPKWKDLRTALWKHRLAAQQTVFHTVENCPGQRKGRFPQVFRNWAEIVENTFAAVHEAFAELTTCFPKRILNLWDIYENLCEIS